MTTLERVACTVIFGLFCVAWIIVVRAASRE